MAESLAKALASLEKSAIEPPPDISRVLGTGQQEPPAERQELTPQSVSRAIPGSIGSLEAIAKTLGVKRIEVSRFVAKHQELQELIADERQASIERVMRQQYDDAMEGNQLARESYMKMVNGYFSKKDDAARSGPQTNIVIKMDKAPVTFKALTKEGEVIDVDAKTLKPVGGEG